MKMTWFKYDNLTTEEADELVVRYNRNGIKTERSLSSDLRHWIVSALLPESGQAPRSDKTYQQRMWGR
ncbi:hypothetical protein [Atlantibacter hermannii]|uniref:hypothetical protein n=1 Tax=Atlantibacter hermannii TaxID=565 RepID=UPI002896C76C|nr:hypothetical protein [Atlantibacter hermannii]